MKLKKFVSLALALVMSLALAVPAFASGAAANTALAQSSEITGTTKTPTIKITVPATGAVVVNPYKMEVLPSGGTAGTDEVQDQIVSATQWVENASDVAIKVSAAVSAKVAGKAKLATASTVTTGSAKPITTNSIYLFLEAVVADDETTAVTDWSSATKAVAAAKGTVTELGTLAKGTGTAADTTGGYLAYHLSGDAVEAPAVAWAAEDKVDVTIAFTFVPVAETVTGG